MDQLNELLTQIELATLETHTTPKEIMLHGAKKMYTYHALDVCLAKLTNNPIEPGKEGVLRAKLVFEKIEKLTIEEN